MEAHVSRELISQALSNLIDNALKYAPRDGTETVVTVGLERQGDRCLLTVADNGPGIPEDKRGRVLERFYRLDDSRSKPGSGLGLSLVQAIAQLHGGQVFLEDAGPGLKVVLDFPLDGKARDDASKRNDAT